MAAATVPSLPAVHAQMLDHVVGAVQSDERFVALLGTGSLAYGGFDEHSDLDFVIVVRADDHAAAMAERQAFAARLGSLLAASEPVDLGSWEPAYGRKAEAQVKWEAAHGRPLGA